MQNGRKRNGTKMYGIQASAKKIDFNIFYEWIKVCLTSRSSMCIRTRHNWQRKNVHNIWRNSVEHDVMLGSGDGAIVGCSFSLFFFFFIFISVSFECYELTHIYIEHCSNLSIGHDLNIHRYASMGWMMNYENVRILKGKRKISRIPLSHDGSEIWHSFPRDGLHFMDIVAIVIHWPFQRDIFRASCWNQMCQIRAIHFRIHSI